MAAEIPAGHLLPVRAGGASMRPRRMAAEITGRIPWPGRKPLSFNEAAANGRGNPGDHSDRATRPVGASMRPRRMAAEIDRAPAPGSGRTRASMRPRRVAAEIIIEALSNGGAFLVASMRPRRMAAEIRRDIGALACHGAASMRPRRMAAEIFLSRAYRTRAAALQ